VGDTRQRMATRRALSPGEFQTIKKEKKHLSKEKEERNSVDWDPAWTFLKGGGKF